LNCCLDRLCMSERDHAGNHTFDVYHVLGERLALIGCTEHSYQFWPYSAPDKTVQNGSNSPYTGTRACYASIKPERGRAAFGISTMLSYPPTSLRLSSSLVVAVALVAYVVVNSVDSLTCYAIAALTSSTSLVSYPGMCRLQAVALLLMFVEF